MNNYLRPAPLALFALILFGGLAFIYWKAQAFDSAQQATIIENLRQLEELDAEWNLDVWRAKDGVTSHYDKLNSPQEKLLPLQKQISDELAPLHDASLDKAAADLKLLIMKKFELVESFKSQNSVLMNSLKFIPTANSELQQMIAEAKFKNPSQAKTFSGLEELTDGLLTATLKYNLAPDTDNKNALEQSISFADSVKPSYSPDIAEQTEILIAHARTILREKERDVALLNSINALNPKLQTKQIDNALSNDFNEQVKHHQEYRLYLMIYSVALLLLLAYVGYQLLQSAKSAEQINARLNRANATLDEQVMVRTEMVTLAMEELKESQVQLVQSEKMASIGQMVAGVTHEINTPLAYVKSGLEIAKTRIHNISELIEESLLLHTMLQSGQIEEEALGNQLQHIGSIAATLSEEDMVNELDGLLTDGLHGIAQISEIVISLKNFSRLDREKIASFDIHEGLDNTLKIAKNVIKHKTVVKQYGEKVRAITCSPSSINQVFLNLISNAAQASGDGGEIKIITAEEDQHVKIEIIDNGSGIPNDVINKIFEPFFTTKQVGEGTGLGLSIVQRIIREHGGDIKVKSKVGLGTKFTVTLPIEMDAPHKTGDMTGNYPSAHLATNDTINLAGV